MRGTLFQRGQVAGGDGQGEGRAVREVPVDGGPAQPRAAGDAVFGHAFGRIADYTTSNPLTRSDRQARLAENRLGASPPTAPIYPYHGLVDEIIPLARGRRPRGGSTARPGWR